MKREAIVCFVQITWTAQNSVTDCGQHCIVVSNSATNGEVEIFYEKFAVALTRVAAVVDNSDGRLEGFGAVGSRQFERSVMR